jgi:glycyl-tRNA synthetase beta subunit
LKVLADLPELTGGGDAPPLGGLIEAAAEPFAPFADWEPAGVLALKTFLHERYQYLLEQRGHDVRTVRAVLQQKTLTLSPTHALRLLGELASFTESLEFQQLAVAFKRVRNLARDLDGAEFETLEERQPDLAALLEHPSERALLEEIDRRRPAIEHAVATGSRYRQALMDASGFKPHVDRFFDDVRVKTDDPHLTRARLRLLRRLERLMLDLADISEIVAE